MVGVLDVLFGVLDYVYANSEFILKKSHNYFRVLSAEKVYRLAKSTPQPVRTVMTNMSYGGGDRRFKMKSCCLRLLWVDEVMARAA